MQEYHGTQRPLQPSATRIMCGLTYTVAVESRWARKWTSDGAPSSRRLSEVMPVEETRLELLFASPGN